jgi:hypothetical protein
MRIAAAAALGAGTKTIFGNPFLVGQGKTLAAAATVQDANISEEYAPVSGIGPMVLEQNDGFIVRNIVALGAAGTVRWSVQAEWAEFLNADFPSM